MLYWANEVVTRIGLGEAVVVILALLLLGVYLVWNRLKRPPSWFFRLGVGIPLFVSVASASKGWREFRKINYYLQRADAMNDAQRNLFLTEAIRGVIRILLVGLLCSLMLQWVVGQRRSIPPRAIARDES
jgi:hypothetical protein